MGTERMPERSRPKASILKLGQPNSQEIAYNQMGDVIKLSGVPCLKVIVANRHMPGQPYG